MTSACSACASTASRPRKSSLVLDGFLEAAQRSVSDFRDKIDLDTLERAVDILSARRDDLPDRAAGARSRSPPI